MHELDAHHDRLLLRGGQPGQRFLIGLEHLLSDRLLEGRKGRVSNRIAERFRLRLPSGAPNMISDQVLQDPAQAPE